MKKLFTFIFLGTLLSLSYFDYSYAQSLNNCPPRTTAGYRYITFTGKAGLGGDQKVEVWFEYGLDKSDLTNKTRTIFLDKEGIFCIRVIKLKPCQVYYYRAVAKNSAGINYGEVRSIKTLCHNSNTSNNPSKEIRNNPNKWILF